VTNSARRCLSVAMYYTTDKTVSRKHRSDKS